MYDECIMTEFSCLYLQPNGVVLYLQLLLPLEPLHDVPVPPLLLHEPLLAPHLDLADVLLQDVDLGRERHVVCLHAAVTLVVGRLVLRQDGHLVLELPHLRDATFTYFF